MDKVRLPREVATAIERTWNRYLNNANPKHIVLTNWKYLDDLAQENDKEIILSYAIKRPIEYMTALVNGYEVEETPEDKVRELWKNADLKYTEYKGVGHDVRQYWNGYIGGVEGTLEALNIKIEGVNT